MIYDPSTGLPKANCSATIQTACFADGGVLGRIPVNQLYGPGMAILNQYPLPNIDPGNGHAATTYTITRPVVKTR